MRNITFDLIENAARRPDAPAILVSGETLTYAQLDELTWKSATYLREEGVRAGDVVALRFLDQINMALAMLGTIRLGATVFSVPSSATSLQCREMERRAGVSMQVVDAIEGASPAQHPALIFTREKIVQIGASKNAIDQKPKSSCVLIHSSGSTGHATIIPIDHRMMGSRVEITRKIFSLDENDRFFSSSGLQYAAPKTRLFATLSVGAAFVLSRNQSVLREIIETKSSVIRLPVLHAYQVLNDKNILKNIDFSFIKIISLGGSHISNELRENISKFFGNRLLVHYGANEVSTISIAYPSDIFHTPGTVGRPPEGVSVEIVDEDHRALPAGHVGAVRVKSPAAISGYNDGSYAHRFRDGWFYPGDLGMWTQDGQLIYYGRSDQMMIRNGINIYPAEIERALVEHSAVRDAVAFPLKHPVHQDIPVCAVSLNCGADADADTLMAFARESLGARAPSLVFILDEIPRDEQGKLVRADLMEVIRNRIGRESSLLPAASIDALSPPALRQLITPVSLQLKAPKHLPLDQLKAWTQIICPSLPAEKTPSVQSTTPIREWLHHILIIARELLQAAKIPVFDEPQVLVCEPVTLSSGAAWKIVVSFPRLDQMPPRLYEIALNGAMNAVSFAITNSVSEENKKALFSLIENGSLAELRKSMNLGKSTFPVLQAANARGIPFTHLGAGVYQLGWGARARRIDRSTTDADSAMGLKLSNNKVITAALLERAGLPHPQHEAARTIAAALAVAKRIGWPVVVKPADRERGEGVSVDVTDATALETAFKHALQLSQGKQVLIERQVEGTCHRLFIAQGRLLYAVKRMPMGVWADGSRTISELVADARRRQSLLPPWRRSEIQLVDDLARASFGALGYNETTIPVAGTFVPLRRIETTAWGGVDEDVSERVHPENLRVAIAAARLFGLDVAGIDMITPDIGIPWFENGAIINEVNFAPLLGGGEISRQRIPDFLDAMLEGNGRIPVHFHVGGNKAFDAAYHHWRHLIGNGVRAVLTTATRTWTSSGEDWRMPASGLYSRCRALVLSSELDALVAVVQTDEFLETGLPLEVLTSINEAEDGLLSYRNGDALDEVRAGQLRAILRSRCRKVGDKQLTENSP